MKPIGERDWKRFVPLKKRALERYCRTTLADVAGLCAPPQSTRENEDSGPSAHEQYLDVYWLVQERNKQMARAFGWSQPLASAATTHGATRNEPCH